MPMGTERMSGKKRPARHGLPHAMPVLVIVMRHIGIRVR
jgi:hypothetical protein